ncbi:MAG: cache domain-containing protein [Candidatus Cloacimonetes bacterium]|nr:cache domain-containing protein [Candidatus Cloacimonadota bacterium]MCF7812965.1 cache domain-containing protein [Candidatus Cloacimonadota bacterium]MCF7867303.1 cache domain-containing protein [Candidatus Cloacimonadota bacterium]MCF7882747.1 cache domain-containing protein [Candidatus Cloacimonadota bacterium]
MKKIFVVLLLLIGLANLSAAEVHKDKDMLIKCEVETAVSMLQTIYNKYEAGEMSIDKAKKLGADLLRDLRYGEDGYFWADTTEGVNVVLFGNKDVEGKNRLEAQDHHGNFFIKDLIAAGKKGGGYVEYWFPKLKQEEPVAKRSYALLFKPFSWVVGTGYYTE